MMIASETVPADQKPAIMQSNSSSPTDRQKHGTSQKDPVEQKTRPSSTTQAEPYRQDQVPGAGEDRHPPRLQRVEVCKDHNGKYRVNIWEQPEPVKKLAVTVGARIGPSYYLTVSETGEIVDGNPPMTKLGSSA